MSYNNKGQKFLDALSLTGYYVKDHRGQSYDWLFNVEEEFMEWLCQYIDSSNVLPLEELLEVEEFEVSSHGKDFDIAHKHLGLDESDLQVEERDVKFLKEELHEADITVYDEVTEVLRAECQEMMSNNCQLKKIKKDAVTIMIEAEQNCCELGERLDLLYATVARHQGYITAVFADYKNTDSEYQLIAQLPLDRYKEQCDIFSGYLENYMDKEFNGLFCCHDENEFASNNIHSSLLLIQGPGQKVLAEIVKELNFLKIRISLELCGSVLECAEGKYLASSLHYAQELKQDFKNILDPEDICRCNGAQSTFEMDSFDVIEAIQQACKQAAEWETLKKVVSHECYLKKCRQRYWMQKLSSLSKYIENQMKHSGTLRMMINTERKLVLNMINIISGFQHNLIDEYENYIIRMNAMVMAKRKYMAYQNSSATLHAQLAQCLNEQMTYNMEPYHGTSSDLTVALIRLSQDINSKERKVFTIALQTKKEVLQKREKNIKEFEKFVFSGPTKKLIFCTAPFTTYKSAALLIDSFEKSMEDCSEKMEHIYLQLEREQILKHQRLLWIYFLMDSKKSLFLLNHLKNALRKMSIDDSLVVVPAVLQTPSDEFI